MMLLERGGRHLAAGGLIGIHPLRQTMTDESDKTITEMRFITNTVMFFAKH
jgi:hypothetical protein